MKGVILAGGFGTRLDPLTRVVNKHLLPVYDKPMIYYPLECLSRSGIREVLVITGGHNPKDLALLVGDGRQFGFKRLQYAVQQRAAGIAHAVGLAEAFADGAPLLVMLGDNLVQHTLDPHIAQFELQGGGARVLLARVPNPQAYGVAELSGRQLIRIVEKPSRPPSDLAVTGIYFFDAAVFDIVRSLRPSRRNELEVTDVNNAYLQSGRLRFGMIAGWWLDAGEGIDAYLEACNRVAADGANHPAPGTTPDLRPAICGPNP